MKLLIVDDNADMRRMIRAVLQRLHAEICECDDGAASLAAYQAGKPNLVLMDIYMGRLNGIRAAQEITTFDPDARIVMVTEYDDEPLRQAAMRAGACDYVLKSDLTKLEEILKSFCESSPGDQ